MVNCLLLITGSVAAIKTWKLRAEILRQLPPNSEVRVVVTQAAQHFLCTPTLAQYPEDFDFSIAAPLLSNTNNSNHQNNNNNVQNNNTLFTSTNNSTINMTLNTPKELATNNNYVSKSSAMTSPSSSSRSPSTSLQQNQNQQQQQQIVFRDQDEWDSYQKRGDAVLHIELRKWADVCCIAPLDANSLAKISTGLADNLLSSVMRAWEWKSKPVVLAPAMNTAMWEHPLTRPQLETIRSFNPEKVTIVEPISKVLECNDVGVGALASLEDIARAVAFVALNATNAGVSSVIVGSTPRNFNNNNNNSTRRSTTASPRMDEQQ